MTDISVTARTSDRILFVLGIAQRPLKPHELQYSLALPARETDRACEKLIQNGHVHMSRGTLSLATKPAS